jgi:hypothetical protein
MTRLGAFLASIVVIAAHLALAPGSASAQSGFAGIVKDTTGAVLPGVTVEASSPALIEGLRTAVTDEKGQYKIVDLRPGTYTVTFALPGFSTLKRDAIELAANFTAPLNVELEVGGVAETVTVTGETPLVDTQTATSQQVLPLQLVDTVPMGGRNIQSIGAVLTGITQSLPDVGGAQGMQQTYMATHGADPRDNSVQVDSMSLNGIEGDGAIQQYFNPMMFSEMSYQTGAISAETSGGGVRLNMIPKDGGNTFRGDLFFSITNSSFQANSLTSDLVKRGLKSADSMDSMHDVNVAVGGPIKVNRLWFFSSFRNWGVNQTVANSFLNLDPTFKTFKPDFSRQVIDNNLINSGILRLTWQATSKLKASAYLDRIFKFRGHERTQATGPWTEEAFGVRNPKIYYTAQIKLTASLTNRLLVDGGWSTNNETYTTWELQPSTRSGMNPIPRTDIILGNTWSAPPNSYFLHVPIRRTWVTSLSYVTGSHALKAGMQWGYGFNRSQRRFMQQGPDPGFSVDLVQRYRNGVPDSVQVYNDPVHGQENLNADVGIYLQDSWTLNRLTITPGIRFEHFNTSISLESVGAGRFVPARTFPSVQNLPNWNDIAPRFGIAYDLFGNAKTALRASVGKYVQAFSTVGFAQVYNPMFEATDTRTWRDLNGDDIAEDNEIGPSQNSQFGIAVTRRPDPNIKRPYSMEYSASVQRELKRGISATLGYFRRDYHRLLYSDNVAVRPQDYTPVVITNPVDGTPLTIYNLNPEKLGAIDIVDKNSSTNSRVYNGIEATFNARWRGATLFGGINSGRQVSNNCQLYVITGQTVNPVVNVITAASNPNATRYCDQSQYHIPFRTQFKIAGNYALPLGLQVSGTFQSYPGTLSYGNGSTSTATSWLNVHYIVNKAIAPGLTQTQETIPLIPPGSKFLNRWNQLDLRLAKKFRFRDSGDWQVQADLFNSLNSHVVIQQNQTFGPALDQPTQVLQGRLLSFGAQLHF